MNQLHCRATTTHDATSESVIPLLAWYGARIVVLTIPYSLYCSTYGAMIWKSGEQSLHNWAMSSVSSSLMNLQNMLEMKYHWRLPVTRSEGNWIKHLNTWGLGIIHLLKRYVRQFSRPMKLFMIHTIGALTVTSNSTPSRIQYSCIEGGHHSNQPLNGYRLTHSEEPTYVKHVISPWISISRLLPPHHL